MTTQSAVKPSTLIIGIAILALLGYGGWKMFHSSAPVQPANLNAPVSVTTAKVQQQDLPLYLSGVGTVTANASVTVKVRTDGQLDKVAFVEGQDVTSGQLLAQIDPRALQAQLAQTQAQKTKDQAQLINARLDLQRYTTLQQQDAATQQQLDTQKALVAQLEAAIKTDDAQINYANVQLSYTTINAPISGRTGVRLVDPGNIVHAADATGLVVINQIDPITVLFTLPGEAVPAINHSQSSAKNGLKAIAYARDTAQPLATGDLILVNNQIDTSSGTVQLKARFANPQHALWPGQYVNVNLIMGDHGNVLTVPAAAIQRGQDGTYVYLVSADNTASMQPVVVARIQDGIAVVSNGLTLDQRVVVDGQYKLKPGARVVEGKPATAPASAAGTAGADKGAAK
ncbi:efflux RND transporter periplasmic adaptor subunit [Herbaspirillum autotrophicum]|uniref:efflux RND transporter periplasmic adaptor subunit n=1 Tax=Herbaspirillum autotrophicum TaxID=180195 RepID=UPI00067A77C2|nr:efflux RND transporter periplasmic adaptor subunit [Herbaspirillum autotrophicum]